ncbi:MAG: hypothetical protein Q4B50_08135 [Bacillota bacterium]|nr:hypothetical protein [Bacillota bacterium]
MEKKELESIIGRIRRAEQERDSKYSAQWQDWERRYRSRTERQREGSNLFVPQTFMQCEVIKARVGESLFSSRPYVAALPRNEGDQQRAANVQTLLDWQMNDRMDLPRLISQQIVGSLVVYGTAVAYTGWKLRTRLLRQPKKVEEALLGGDGKPLLDQGGRALRYASSRVETKREVIYDDPMVSALSLYDFFIDPEAEQIEDARFLGHREYLSRSQLEDLEAQGGFRIDWEKLQSGDPEGRQHFGDPEDPGLYLLHHYWEDQRHVVILGRSQCALDEDNPFWHGEYPYDKCCFVSVPGEFYGIGVPEILAGLQDELNTSRNQRIDYNSMSLRRMWKLRKGCGLSNADLIWRQNGILQVENMDDVQEINLQSLPADAFANENSIKQDMQDATGCHDIIMGLAYSNETATTTMTRDNNASLRFKTVVNALVKDIMLPIARKFISMDRQFLREERAFRLLNQEDSGIFHLDPTDLGGDYDVIYCGSAVESLANREMNKNKALQAYSLALSDPAYQADDRARLALFRRVLEALDMTEAEQLLPRSRSGQSLPQAAETAGKGVAMQNSRDLLLRELVASPGAGDEAAEAKKAKPDAVETAGPGADPAELRAAAAVALLLAAAKKSG